MPRTGVSVPPEAIRIEDEVWQDAFARREPSPRAARRLRALEGGLAADAPLSIDTPLPGAPREALPEPRPAPASRPVRRRAPAARPARPVAASASPQRAEIDSPQRPRPRAVAAPEGSIAPAAESIARPEGPSLVGAGVPGRRTVTIRGRGAERNLPLPGSSRRRPPRRRYERAGFKPDRVAMWAVLLGLLLVLVAVASAHG
jgi:hypothetical protein